MRSDCLSCNRSSTHCYCGSIRKFDPGFSLVLVAHPKEARRSVGTVRIAHLSAADSRLVIGTGPELDRSEGLAALADDPSVHLAMLFPGLQAAAMESSGWLPQGKRLALVVVDGTWAQAKRMIRTSRFLAGLPQLTFSSAKLSEYGFRQQPHPRCLSTVEAVHTVIDKLDAAGICPAPPARGHDAMLGVFRELVRTQLAYQRGGTELGTNPVNGSGPCPTLPPVSPS